MRDESLTPQWARLKDDENRGLRRGAWYRVVELTAGDAVLDVNRKSVPVPRTALDIVSGPPRVWTIVRRPRDAKGLVTEWDDKYLVCPGCRNRVPLKGNPHSLRCPRCDQLFRVGWDEWFMGAPEG